MTENLLFKKLLREVIIRSSPIVKPRGAIVELYLEPFSAKYNHDDIVKYRLSHHFKKKNQKKEKTLHQYSVVGKCVRFRRRGINSSFILRNVINLIPFEMSYAFFTLAISAYIIRDHNIKPYRFKYKRSSRYELRRHSAAKSQSIFEYLVD